jgi:hypothetical protein
MKTATTPKIGAIREQKDMRSMFTPRKETTLYKAAAVSGNEGKDIPMSIPAG